MSLLESIRHGLRSWLFESVVEDTEEGWSEVTSEATGDDIIPLYRRKDVIEEMQTLYATNPLAKNHIRYYAAKVFGEGFRVFSDDPAIEDEIHRALSRIENLKALATYLLVDGDVFLKLDFAPATGRVIPTYIPAKEIVDIFYRNGHPAYYLRRRFILDEENGMETRTQQEERIPYDEIFQISVNKRPNAKFGVSDLYAASAWLKRHEQAVRAAARRVELENAFAWHITLDNASKADIQKRVAAYTTRSFRENLMKGGGIIISNEKETWNTLARQSGQGIDSAALRETKLMAVAGSSLPEFILTGDASNGNYSSTQAQDMPFAVMIADYQNLWRRALTSFLRCVLGKLQATGIIAPTITKAKEIHVRDRARYEELYAITSVQPLHDDYIRITWEAPAEDAELSFHFPEIVASDDEREVKVLEAERALGIVSKERVAKKRGYDYHWEKTKMAAEDTIGHS